MAERLRVALIGTGGISRFAHIPAWRSLAGVEVVAVAEPVAERRLQALEGLGDPQGQRVRAFASYAEMLDACRPDLVDVTIQPGGAKNLAIEAALGAGCHVTCQKPFTLDLPSAVALTDRARTLGRILSVNQQARFAPAFAAARRAIEEGGLGDLRTIRLWSDFPNPGDRQWLEYSVHSFDLVRFWAGREPRRVRAWWKRQTEQPQFVLGVWLDFGGPLMAEIWDEMSSPTTLRWGFRLMGDRGSLSGHEAFGEGMVPAEVAMALAGVPGETLTPVHPPYVPAAFACYFAALVAAIEGRGPVPTPAADNLQTLRLAFAARRAADDGAWVDL